MAKINGFEAALEALRGLDSKSQERILSDISKTDPKTAIRLKKSMVVFDDLLKINPQGMIKLFQEVPDAKWVMALRGKSPEFVNALFKHMAQRKGDLIRAALTQLGPQPVTKIEAAQSFVLEKALELETKGLLVFASDHDPLV